MTAVEWLAEEIYKWENGLSIMTAIEIVNQAKELEKEQIENAFCDGVDDEYEHHINGSIRKNSEQYYNETFKQL